MNVKPFLLALSLLPTFCLQAQTTWNDSTGNHLWNDSSNWSNGQPNSTTDAIFSGTGGTIVLNNNFSNGLKSIHFTATGSSYVLTSNTNTSVRTLSGPGSFAAANGASNSSLTIDKVALTANAGSTFGNNGANNNLTITGSGSKLSVAYSAGLSIGSGTGTIAANSGNAVLVEKGGILYAGAITVGGKGQGNSLVVTGTGSSLEGGGLAGQANFNLNIGNTSAAATNSVSILNGATAAINYWDTNIIGGSLTIGKNSSLTMKGAARSASLNIGSRGILYGAGTITATSVKYGSFSGLVGDGAKVFLGEAPATFGTLKVNGNWINTNLTLTLKLGDLLGTPEAGIDYDYLDLNGVFTYGGNLAIDLSGVVLPGSVSDIRLIGWTGTAGSIGDLSLSFINGSALNYSFQSDGLYLTVPEPGTIAFLVVGLGAVVLGARRRQAA